MEQKLTVMKVYGVGLSTDNTLATKARTANSGFALCGQLDSLANLSYF